MVSNAAFASVTVQIKFGLTVHDSFIFSLLSKVPDKSRHIFSVFLRDVIV